MLTNIDWSKWNKESGFQVSISYSPTSVISKMFVPPSHPSLNWGTGFQLENISNIDKGDSGGGAFYNGQFVGINQSLNTFNYPNVIVQKYP